MIVSHVELQVAEDQEVSRRELEEEVYYTQQSVRIMSRWYNQWRLELIVLDL